MLDSETKRRIDSARDILVGKVPDPKSQVEQITIALIYKFMDDMDKQSIAMDGKASFFKGEFKKYGWSEIFNPRMGGVEMLNLYGEAITRMGQNANLPELFRNIFKNAYLPYRDPETLKLFLKTINEFTYDHSEKLGDAFEYLLSVLGSQGDAGQFRTPRHIIDFMVQVLDPQKNETVLDPACGTAGFLISAYKHIVKSAQDSGKPLTNQEKQKVYERFTGYDISPDMVRLSLVNLYLHGFVKPQVHEYDSLASEERWNEYADVILANPPFMSPKGGIMPHKKFSVQSNRSEVLFVDYMAEHLTPNGRAAIIVPEGIIFQSAGAYKQLRKYLIEHNFLWAVVSLPAGAFNPYSGVKTSILLLDKSLAKKTNKVLFVKVENDGFDLGAQRRPIDRNDLPQALKVLKSFRASTLDGKTESFTTEVDSALIVSISKLGENEGYNLSADRYRNNHVVHTVYDVVPIGHFMKQVPTIDPRTNPEETFELWSIPAYDAGEPEILLGKDIGSQKKCVSSGDILISRIIPHIRRVLVVPSNQSGQRQMASTEWIVFSGESINPGYLRQILLSDVFNKQFMQTITGVGGSLLRANPKAVGEITIPIPPLEIQSQIVDEIAAQQHIIDGARQVVESWKPSFELDDEWEKVNISDICEVKGGKRLPKGETYAKEKTKHPYIRVVDLIGTSIDISDLRYITDDVFKEVKNYTISSEDVYVSIAGTIGLLGTVPDELNGANLTENAAKLVLQKDKIDKMFLTYVGISDFVQQQIKKLTHAVGVPKLALERIRTIQIPLPPLDIQREIVARIETERAIVEGNRKLICLYEEKVKKVIERVWEG
jgi:type I restriction enzyme M protein